MCEQTTRQSWSSSQFIVDAPRPQEKDHPLHASPLAPNPTVRRVGCPGRRKSWHRRECSSGVRQKRKRPLRSGATRPVHLAGGGEFGDRCHERTTRRLQRSVGSVSDEVLLRYQGVMHTTDHLRRSLTPMTSPRDLTTTACPRCGLCCLRRSVTRWWERPVRWLTTLVPYRCNNCYWRGWRGPDKSGPVKT